MVGGNTGDVGRLFLGFERGGMGGRDRCGGSAAGAANSSTALPPLTLAALKHHSINSKQNDRFLHRGPKRTMQSRLFFINL